MDVGISDFEKIQVILHEYDSLRNEIVQRWLGAQQQISIGVLVLIGVITIIFTNKTDESRRSKKVTTTSRHRDFVLYGMLVIAIFIFGFAMFQFRRDTEKSAERVREIESQVNKLAGEEILQWETRWGGGVTGYFGLAKPIKKPPEGPK